LPGAARRGTIWGTARQPARRMDRMDKKAKTPKKPKQPKKEKAK
jgi:hypothetical protein